MHNLSTFGARKNHEQLRTHKTNHDPDLGEAITFPLIVFYAPLHEAHIQMAFCPERVPKSPQLRLPQLWEPITMHANLPLWWDLKQSCSLRWDLSNGMLYTTCTWVNRVDSWLLMVRSQIVNLTFVLSFGHNLCFKCPNGSCKPILDI